MVVGSLMDLSGVPSASRRPAEKRCAARRKESFLRMIAGPGMLRAIHQTLTMRELCIVLESGLGQVFVDETGTTARYEVHVDPAMAGSSKISSGCVRGTTTGRHASAARHGDTDGRSTRTLSRRRARFPSC